MLNLGDEFAKVLFETLTVGKDFKSLRWASEWAR